VIAAWVATAGLVAVDGAQRGLDSIADRAASFAVAADDRSIQQFNARYVVSLDDPQLESLEIVTPFRRAVQAVLLDSGRSRQPAAVARRAILPHAGRISMILHLRFSPQNLLVRIPAFTLVVHERSRPGAGIEPVEVWRVPRSVLGDPVPPGTPILRGTVEAVFDRSRIGTAPAVLVGVVLEGREIRRVPVDLRPLE